MKTVIFVFFLLSSSVFAWDYPGTCQQHSNPGPVIIVNSFRTSISSCTSTAGKVEYSCYSCDTGSKICQRKKVTLDSRCNYETTWGYVSSQCPVGTFQGSDNMCYPVDFSQYNNNLLDCFANGGMTSNPHFDVAALGFYGFDCVQKTASVSALSQYDNDPSGCDQAGGYLMLSGGQKKCGTLGDVFGEIITNSLGFIPAFSLFKSDKLKGLAKTATLDKLREIAFNPTKPDDTPNVNVGLPKLPSPAAAQGGAKPSFPVDDTPPPANSSGYVSSEPQVTIDTAYNHISDSYIPVKSSGDPIIDYSVVDRFNTSAKVSSPSASLSDIVPQVGTTQKPVKETFDISTMMPEYAPPPVIATVPQTTTRSTVYSGTYPIEVVTSTRSYPDGSSSMDVYRFNTATKEATLESTIVASTGESSTTVKTFTVPDLTVTPTNITGTLPSTTTPNPDTALSSTLPAESSTVQSSPDAISGQSLDTLINANMPAYSLPAMADFTLYNLTDLEQGVDNFTDMFENIRTQLSTFGTLYDDTMSVLNGSFTPPVIPAGSCGDFMSFDVFNQHVDLCPPLATFSSKYAPLVTFLITLSGLILAVRIYLSALRD